MNKKILWACLSFPSHILNKIKPCNLLMLWVTAGLINPLAVFGQSLDPGWFEYFSPSQKFVQPLDYFFDEDPTHSTKNDSDPSEQENAIIKKAEADYNDNTIEVLYQRIGLSPSSNGVLPVTTGSSKFFILIIPEHGVVVVPAGQNQLGNICCRPSGNRQAQTQQPSSGSSVEDDEGEGEGEGEDEGEEDTDSVHSYHLHYSAPAPHKRAVTAAPANTINIDELRSGIEETPLFWEGATESELKAAHITPIAKTSRSAVFKFNHKGNKLVLKRALTVANNEDLKEEIEAFEMLRAMQMQHKNLIQMLFTCKYQDPRGQQSLLGIVFRFFPTDLFTYNLLLINHPLHRTEQENLYSIAPPLTPNHKLTRFLIRQMFAGLIYLHSHEYSHGDLKPENCLIRRMPGTTNRISFHLVLCDFSSVNHMKEKVITCTVEMQPPIHYGHPFLIGDYDLYASGLIILNLLVPGFANWNSAAIRKIESKYAQSLNQAKRLGPHEAKLRRDEILYQMSHEASYHAQNRPTYLEGVYHFLRSKPNLLRGVPEYLSKNNQLILMGYYLISNLPVSRPSFKKIQEWLDKQPL